MARLGRSVAAFVVILAASAPVASGTEFLSEQTADTFVYGEPISGATVTSKITNTLPGRWFLWQQFAGLGDRWVQVSASDDVLGVWVPSLPAARRVQALPSLSGALGASTNVNLGPGNVGTMRVAEVRGVLTTPAGSFGDVTRLELWSGSVPITSIWVARWIGVIQWTRAGRTFSLRSATIRGTVYPLPPSLDDLPSDSPPPVIYGEPFVSSPPAFGNVVSLPVAPGTFRGDALETGDLDGDRLTDVVVAWRHPVTSGVRLSVFHQAPGGALRPPVVLQVPGARLCESLRIADVTGDTRKDLVLGLQGSVQVFAQTVAGTFQAGQTISCPARLISVGDVDGDGRMDVVTVGATSPAHAQVGVFVMRQDALGRLGAPVPHPAIYEAGNDLEVADVSGDYRDDIVVMSGGRGPAVAVLVQLGAGQFMPAVYYPLPGAQQVARGLGVGDVTGDGLRDVVVTFGALGSSGDRVAVFAQNHGRLEPADTYPSHRQAQAVVVADLNSDDADDVVAANGGQSSLSWWAPDAHGNLGPHNLVATPSTSLYGPHSLSVADVNGDRLPDVLSVSNSAGLVIHHGR